MSHQCLILVSTVGLEQQNNSRRMEDLFSSYKYDVVKIDGSLPENKDLRDKLFDVSGQRGKYPQCFIETSDNAYTFIGTWDMVLAYFQF